MSEQAEYEFAVDTVKMVGTAIADQVAPSLRKDFFRELVQEFQELADEN